MSRAKVVAIHRKPVFSWRNMEMATAWSPLHTLKVGKNRQRNDSHVVTIHLDLVRTSVGIAAHFILEKPDA